VQHLTLVEYGKVAALYKDKGEKPVEKEGGVVIDKNDYDALDEMLRTADKRDDDLGKLMNPCMWRLKEGRRKAIQMRNYAGVIMLPSGLCLEILPKIHLEKVENSRERTLEILLKMLRAWPDSPFQTFKRATLESLKEPLLESFITCFLDDVAALIRRGLCSDYVAVEDNQIFLRGKLKLHEHIRHNAARQERFYVSYDDFLPDRPENRLVKNALLQVARWSGSCENQRRCKIYGLAFADVPPSKDFAADFAACRPDRNLQHYEAALSWCRLILYGQSPIPQAGSHSCLSLLFPMEKLFEYYVAKNLRSQLAKEWQVTEQASQRYLVESYKGKTFYRLKPDLLFINKNNSALCVIADTKWKLLKSDKDLKEPGDLYQIFAYAEKYLATRSFLIYPKTESSQQPFEPFWFRKPRTDDSEKSSILYALLYDLETDDCLGMDESLGTDQYPISRLMKKQNNP